MDWYIKVRRAMSADDFERWEEGGVCPTLNVADNTGDVRATVLMPVGTAVRRLTPRECERLQGFPDDWTAGQADSHRYKQMGNAVTVHVAHYVAALLQHATTEAHG